MKKLIFICDSCNKEFTNGKKEIEIKCDIGFSMLWREREDKFDICSICSYGIAEEITAIFNKYFKNTGK